MTIKQVKIKAGLASVRSAIAVRKKITELYAKYHEFSGLAEDAAGIKHFDFKRAVDALHYLGGGYPHPNSKGRMQALLDSFVGMYRILDFIGSGDLVVNHLKKQGVTCTLADEFRIDDRDLTANEITYLTGLMGAGNVEGVATVRDLVTSLVYYCEGLQGDICKLADSIKDGHRPAAQEALGVTDEEYDRLHDIVKFTSGNTPKGEDKARTKKEKVALSFSNFNQALSFVTTK